MSGQSPLGMNVPWVSLLELRPHISVELLIQGHYLKYPIQLNVNSIVLWQVSFSHKGHLSETWVLKPIKSECKTTVTSLKKNSRISYILKNV